MSSMKTSSSNKKTAVILFNLGGPDSIKSIRPFLFNLFHDKAILSLSQPWRFLLAFVISKKREKVAQKIYGAIGGKSPLLEITQGQAALLEKELSSCGNFKVFVAMRYWKPFISDIVRDIENYDIGQIILLPLYPQFSSATTNSSFTEFAKRIKLKQKDPNKKIPIKVVCCYPTEPDFINAHTALVMKKINECTEVEVSNLRLLFSAHGLPQNLVDGGDPYVFQIRKTMEAIINNLPETHDSRICYQSKVGPLKWTSPSLEYELRKVALDKKIPLIVPISFVSENSETLFELDIEYKNLANRLGIKKYLRVPALNLDANFIKSLAVICKKVSTNNEPSSFESAFSGCLQKRICPKKFKFCPNRNRCRA